MPSAEVVLQVLAALGGAGIAGALVNGFINRKKLGAEATKLIGESWDGVVTRLEAENERLIKKTESQDSRLDELERWKRLAENREEEHRRVLQQHAAADHLLIEKLRKAFPDDEFSEMPPLYPPRATTR